MLAHSGIGLSLDSDALPASLASRLEMSVCFSVDRVAGDTEMRLDEAFSNRRIRDDDDDDAE